MKLKTIALALALTTTTTAASAATKVFVDNTEIKFENEPAIVDGRVMVPVRAVFEQAGAVVEWDNDTRVTTLTYNDYVVRIKEGDPYLVKNGKPVALDVPAAIIDERLAIPVRAISEAMDFGVTWNSLLSTVLISTNGKEYRSTSGWKTGFQTLKDCAFVSENNLDDIAFFDLDDDGAKDVIGFLPAKINADGTVNSPALWISGACFNDVLNSEYTPYALAVADIVESDRYKEIIILYNGDMGRCAGVYRYDGEKVYQIMTNDSEDGLISYNNTLFIDGADNIISDADGLSFLDCMLNTGIYSLEGTELKRYKLEFDKALGKSFVRIHTDNLPYCYRIVSKYEKGTYVDSAEGDDIIFSNDIAGFKLIDTYMDSRQPSKYEFFVERADGIRMVIWPYNV